MNTANTLGGLLAIALVTATANRVCRCDEIGCFQQLDPYSALSNHGGNRIVKSYVKLDGIASGGELVLIDMLNPSPDYSRIDTQAGEAAEAVLERMATALNESNKMTPFRVSRPNIKCADGNVLKTFGGSPGQYVFGGTETGLGIPPAPTSLSVSYVPESQEVLLCWENPVEPYDAVKANPGGILGATATSVTEKWAPPKYQQPDRNVDRIRDRGNMGLRRFHVIGCRNGVLSNAAVITLNYKDGSQEELDTQPFTAGVSPNWKAWSHNTEPGAIVLEEGTRSERRRFERNAKSSLKPADKSFFQIIKSHSPNAVGGVCRKFLGLKPGHTYRLWTRMNTIKMDEARENWLFSFHAAAHAKGVTLTPEQMAGAAALPDGSTGPTAGQVAAFAPGVTTKGKFEEVSTEKKAGPHGVALDITLPADAEVITVWFRVNGMVSTGVGFDWIKLKDVTDAGLGG